jgi:UDP-N-acetylmuramyl pentapeptide phosphotransferase/UDP-N-acetylglucosamine-1-phosphate transferase
MPYWISVGFTLFVYILIINAYNLIDGVDGLAGSLALVASAAFAFIAIKIKDITMATTAVATIGALLPFLRLNISKNKKIFMGDTGSMLVGFLVAFYSVRFIGATQTTTSSLIFTSAPVMVLSIVFFPLLDTFRIFIYRMFILKTSPFSADKNHLHHRFLDLGFSHLQTTAYIVFLNILLITFSYSIRDMDIHFQFVLLIIVGTLLYSILFIYNWLVLKKLLPEFLKP